MLIFAAFIDGSYCSLLTLGPMLSRRNIRVKVMQFIYANERGSFNTPSIAKQALLQNINHTYETGLYILYFLRRVAQYAQKEADMRGAKHLPTKDDLNFSTRLVDNEFILELEQHKLFNSEIAKYKVDKIDLDDANRKFFRELMVTPEYKAYIALPQPSVKDHVKIIKFLFNKVLLASEVFTQHLEEEFSNWIDDQQIITYRMNDFLEHYALGKTMDKVTDLNIAFDDREFASDLFQYTLNYQDEFSELIEPKLENWDVERIAILDLILMKMALCELMYFAEIPIKVTINEYIEIAKQYSTPKSKDFVNGVLDKIMKELKESGRIRKSGRGLQG